MKIAKVKNIIWIMFIIFAIIVIVMNILWAWNIYSDKLLQNNYQYNYEYELCDDCSTIHEH